jgi:hypothetical protein
MSFPGCSESTERHLPVLALPVLFGGDEIGFVRSDKDFETSGPWCSVLVTNLGHVTAANCAAAHLARKAGVWCAAFTMTTLPLLCSS